MNPLDYTGWDTFKPAVGPGNALLGSALQADPNATYGTVLPYAVDNATGARRFAMPSMLRSFLQGGVDLADGPSTGTVTPDASGTLGLLAGSNVLARGGDGLLAAAGPKLKLDAAAMQVLREMTPGFRAATMDNPAFAQWFGQSKAVDAAGNPKVLYHGTKGDIQEFSPEKLGSSTGVQSAKQAYFFTDKPHVAETYAENAPNEVINARRAQAGQQLLHIRHLLEQEFDRSGRIQNARADGRLSDSQFQEQWRGYQENVEALRARELKLGEDYRTYSRPSEFGGNIVPVHLKLENPFIKDYGGKEYRDESFNDILTKAKAAGHDGVIFRDVYDAWKMWGGGDYRSDVHAVFDPTQIKSAIGNSGKFDPKDPRITAGIAGLMAGGTAAASGGQSQ